MADQVVDTPRAPEGCSPAMARMHAGNDRLREDRAAASRPHEVLVTEVVQKDVPVSGEWVGTTDGYINAQIRAKVQGYLLTQDVPRRLARSRPAQLLFQIDPRQFQAALDQADRRPRPGAGEPAPEPAERRALHAARQGRRGQPAGARQRRPGRCRPTRRRSTRPRRRRAGAAQPRLDQGHARRSTASPGIARRRSATWSRRRRCMTTVSQVDPIKVYFPISEQEYLRFADAHRARRRTERCQQAAGARADPRRRHASTRTAGKVVGDQPRRSSRSTGTHPDRGAVPQPGQPPAARAVTPRCAR